jgi:ADP-ribose pyrophosphatase
MPAKINSHVTLHRGRIFNLVNENYTLMSAVTTEMDFIQHPGAVAIVPFINQNELLLIKQYRHAIREFIWEIPAGTLESQESALNCAKRELTEETGFSANTWHQIGRITPLPGCSNERIHIFLASDLMSAKQKLDEDEVLNVHQRGFNEALNMITRGEIHDGKTISGLFLAFDWLKKHRPDIISIKL